MNFSQSEEHLRNWEGFQEKNNEGVIALNDLMHLFSGPYFLNRREPDYFSNMGKYISDFIDTLHNLEHAGAYWRLRWFEKLGFSFALKFGLI